MAVDTSVLGLSPETPGGLDSGTFYSVSPTIWQQLDKTLDSTPPHIIYFCANPVRSVDGLLVRARIESSNTKKIGGSTKVEGVPVRRTVRCYRRSDGMFIKETLSRPDGTYDLGGFVPGESYVLTCLDDVPLEDFNDLLFAQVTPVDVVVEDQSFGKDAPTP